jgi:flagellar basal body-associated protein FliL
MAPLENTDSSRGPSQTTILLIVIVVLLVMLIGALVKISQSVGI